MLLEITPSARSCPTFSHGQTWGWWPRRNAAGYSKLHLVAAFARVTLLRGLLAHGVALFQQLQGINPQRLGLLVQIAADFHVVSDVLHCCFWVVDGRSVEHMSELQSLCHFVCC